MGRNTTQPITHDTAEVEANKCQRAEEAIDAKGPNAILDAKLCRTSEDFVNLRILLNKEVSTASQPHRRQQQRGHETPKTEDSSRNIDREGRTDYVRLL